jgi:hypothetical protein
LWAFSNASITPASGAGRNHLAGVDHRRQPRHRDDRLRAHRRNTGPVAYRAVLSGSGRTLAIVPQARLAEGGTYAVAISGLADAVGGAVIVPPITFTTQDTSAPQYEADLLTFSFPDEQGRVTLSGPAGTLAPGSSILVINESTGEVATVAVNNDGSVGGPNAVGGDLVAHVSDRLIVTITDLQGRTVSFHRSTYVRADGQTAVGNGGGDIVGTGGVEIRVPEDAVMQGAAAVLKVAAIAPQDYLRACCRICRAPRFPRR